MAVTYYVALPFIRTEDGVAPGEAQECQSEGTAIRRAEGMSRDPVNAGAVAFKRAGDPNVGEFSDAVVLKKFGDILLNATTFRFDGSDLMPGSVGAGTFWTGMVDFVNGASAADVAAKIDASWPKS